MKDRKKNEQKSVSSSFMQTYDWSVWTEGVSFKQNWSIFLKQIIDVFWYFTKNLKNNQKHLYF